jgi:hypothetical protein
VLGNRKAFETHVTRTVLEAVPKEFFVELQRRAQAAYRDEFHSVKNCPTVLPEQRLAKLKADRQSRMEWELHQAAIAAGVHVTATPVVENDWSYVYAKSSSIGLTQSYVQFRGDLPKEAKFRERLAAASQFPQLPLAGESPSLYEPCEFYALIAHNPIGHQFTDNKQMLGSIELCVPDSAMKRWVFQKSLTEIIGLYPTVAKRQIASRDPTLKKGAQQQRKK